MKFAKREKYQEEKSVCSETEQTLIVGVCGRNKKKKRLFEIVSSDRPLVA